MKDVIVALATAPMKSALGIVRVSGDDTFDVVSKITTASKEKISTKGIHHTFINIDGKNIDEVVLLSYVAPQSFTGENSVEIICHGSVLIANEIVAGLIASGARMAVNGEYSSRAVLNGKLDLIQAESINDMINATTKEAKSLSLMSLEGQTSELVKPIKTKIADLLSLIEVNIDYPEYLDIEVANKDKIIKDCSLIIDVVNTLIKEGNDGKIIKEGINLLILGKPNVGKSSLLNVLIKEDKAIVTNIPGTTRDVVDGEFVYKGIKYRVVDTAGIRESDDVVEKIGVNKAINQVEKADLILCLVENEDEIKLFEDIIKDKKCIYVRNKKDTLCTFENKNLVYISALNNDVEPLLEKLNDVIGISEDAFNKPSLNNARQIGLLTKIRNILIKCVDDAKNDIPVDLIAGDLHLAYNYALELLGESNFTDFDKEIFSRFCVGK